MIIEDRLKKLNKLANSDKLNEAQKEALKTKIKTITKNKIVTK